MSEFEQHVNEDGELIDGPEPDDEPEPDDAPDDEPEPDDPEPAAETGDWSEKEAAERYGKVGKSFETYKASIDRNLEEKALDLLGCPLCYSTDHPGYVNKHALGHVPEDVQANVQTFLGFARETEYEAAPEVTVCTDCGGLGKVKTGSRVAEHMTITCPTCKGYGYAPPPGFTTNQQPSNGETSAAVGEALADIETGERDNWGEPRVLPDGTLNGNFGKMPQFKSVHPVYGVTANLTPEEIISG